MFLNNDKNILVKAKSV